METNSRDLSTITAHIKIVGSYFDIDMIRLLNKEVLYAYQADLYDQSVFDAEILENLDLIDKYGNLEEDIKELQNIETIKKDLNARFQAIDSQLMAIVKQIHKLKHEAFLLEEKESFLKKRQLKSLDKRMEELNTKLYDLAKMEKQLFEEAFISKEKVINELINKYLINVNDINDANDIRVIEKVREEIKFFNSGNFYKHLLTQIDDNVNSLEVGHLSNPLENLDSFIFYTKGLVVACQPKLKKVRQTLQKLYTIHPEYQQYSKMKIRKEYKMTLKVLESLHYITDNLSFLMKVIRDNNIGV